MVNLPQLKAALNGCPQELQNNTGNVKLKKMHPQFSHWFDYKDMHGTMYLPTSKTSTVARPMMHQEAMWFF
jgi:hypothetical protein